MSGTIDDLFKLPFIGIGYLFTKIMNVLAKIATLGIAGSETNAPSEAMSKKMIEILEKLLGAKIYFTVGPKEHTDGNSFYSNLESKREILFDDSQGSENKKTVARIEYNKEKDQFELPYKLFINHAPGVLVYRISVLGCGIGLNTQGANLDPKNMRNELGADENAQQEEQGERTFKSTLFDALNKTIEPSQFFNGGEKVENPKLDYEWQTGYRELGGNSWDTYEAEEEYIEKEITETVEVPKTDHADSFDNITQYDNRVLFTTPPYLKDTDETMAGDEKELLPSRPELINISENGGLDSKEPIKVKISMRSGGGKGVGDGTKKSTTQEIDEDKLEQDNEVEGEIEHNEVENEEEIEKEDEAESGEEKEQEGEKEDEREDETEKEGEKEPEKEKEKEKEPEKEQESEEESESEGEIVIIILVAISYKYNLELKEKSVKLENNDRQHEQKHQQNEQKIKILEQKNGHEQRQINELKEQMSELRENYELDQYLTLIIITSRGTGKSYNIKIKILEWLTQSDRELI
ncbi:18944_t:CDS:10 [Funneliformis geosporum]|nr:18944_t:CDS:10 [Funneliformis geosporum]